MRVFKNKFFSKWAQTVGLHDDQLMSAVVELEQGLIDADLGACLVKKRLAIGDGGKRGGLRTLIVYKSGFKVFFVYGFAKNSRSNIRTEELKALKRLAKELLGYTDETLNEAIRRGAIIEVGKNE